MTLDYYTDDKERQQIFKVMRLEREQMLDIFD